MWHGLMVIPEYICVEWQFEAICRTLENCGGGLDLEALTPKSGLDTWAICHGVHWHKTLGCQLL